MKLLDFDFKLLNAPQSGSLQSFFLMNKDIKQLEIDISKDIFDVYDNNITVLVKHFMIELLPKGKAKNLL